jgi:hypothetical protein
MALETVLSIAMLGGFIWAICFLLPRSLKQHDPLAFTCAMMTALVAFLLWLVIAVGIQSASL